MPWRRAHADPPNDEARPGGAVTPPPGAGHLPAVPDDSWDAVVAIGEDIIRRHRVTRTPLPGGGESLESWLARRGSRDPLYRDPWRDYRLPGDPPPTPEARSGRPRSMWLARDEYPADAPLDAIPADAPPPAETTGDATDAARRALARYEELARVLRGALADDAPAADPLTAAIARSGVSLRDAATLARHARRVLKDEAAALDWVLSATPHDLRGATPLDVARGGDVDRVHEVLHELEHGSARGP